MTDINQARRKVFVVGVGMTKFEKPGAREVDYTDLAREAGTKALQDAGVSYDKIEQACVGYVYGESTSGEAAVYELGLTGIPIYNVNNNCSTGSTALFMAKQFIEGGLAECVLALGFEKMQKGSLNLGGSDRRNPLQRHIDTMNRVRGEAEGPMAVQMFGGAAREHIERYGSTKLQFAKVAEKNHRHSANNPYAQFQTVYTLDEVMASTTIFDPLTKLQCCPTSNGAGAAVLCSEAFVKANHLQDQAVEIAGMAMATDFASSFEKSCIKMIGSEMSAVAAQKALKQARLTVNDIQVIELHDCFSANELITMKRWGFVVKARAESSLIRAL